MRIASVVFSHYPSDPRPRREAEALVEAGMSVDIICLKGNGEKKEEVVNGVRVFRLPVLQRRGIRLQYLWEYGWFFVMAFLKLSFLHLRRGYRVVHVHNMPDALVFCTLLPRLSGSRILLDLHDPMPEVYMTKYFVPISHPSIRFLRLMEKWSIRFVHSVITPNIAFRDLFISRGCPDSKISIVMNSPQEKIFNYSSKGPNTEQDRDGRFTIMYHGLIAERNGLDTALDAIVQVRKVIPDLAFWIYGGGDHVTNILKRIEELGVSEIVQYYGYAPQERLAELIPSIDVGIIPNKRSPFTDLNFPTRIFEYLAMKKPLIVPRTEGILDYFGEDSMLFFDPENPRSLAEKIIQVYKDPVGCQQILSNGVKVYRTFRWELQKMGLISLVRGLLCCSDKRGDTSPELRNPPDGSFASSGSKSPCWVRKRQEGQ